MRAWSSSAERLFGDLPATDAGDVAAAGALLAAAAGSSTAPISSRSISASAVEGVPYHHPDHFALQVLSTALGGGMSSRLFQEARENRGLCYSIFSFASAYADTGQLGVYAGTDPEDVAELMQVVGRRDRAAGRGARPRTRSPAPAPSSRPAC